MTKKIRKKTFKKNQLGRSPQEKRKVDVNFIYTKNENPALIADKRKINYVFFFICNLISFCAYI